LKSRVRKRYITVFLQERLLKSFAENADIQKDLAEIEKDDKKI
jgi:hypothetical protein